MHNFVFRKLSKLRQNYWFWPSTMTFGAVVIGFFLPYLDSRVGSDWVREIGVVRSTQVEGARAILTTLAGATLGVAGVAFSVTIVAVSFASANYGPRLIGNFMSDRKNQIVLGIFVATFAYCITVLSTVHGGSEDALTTQDAFVPQLSVFFALLLTLAAVGALIAYIHHVPESINIMNLTATIGEKLQRSIIEMLENEDRRENEEDTGIDVEAWQIACHPENAQTVCAVKAGFLQQFDMKGLHELAHEKRIQILLHRAPGDFLVPGEIIMSALPDRAENKPIVRQMRDCCTQGANRTDVQDIRFLSDQLVEVLGRALSSGINDPPTAILCLNWLRAGLVEFARRAPAQPARNSDRVLYRRMTLEAMLNRSFDEMRQYLAADRTAALHGLSVLADIAVTASRQTMAEACVQQMHRLARSANELLDESLARDEVVAELNRALQLIASHQSARTQP